MTILNTMCYHIFRIYKPNVKQLEKLNKIIHKFLWSIDKIDGTVYRFKVAKNRMEADFSKGGLNLLTCDNQCFKVWLPAFINCMKHAIQYNDSTLRILFDQKQIPIKKITENIGYHYWNENLSELKSMQSISNESYFERANDFFKDLEDEKSIILYTPMVTLSYFYQLNIEYFTNNEVEELNYNNLITITSILEFNQIDKNRLLILPILKRSLSSILSQSLLNN